MHCPPVQRGATRCHRAGSVRGRFPEAAVAAPPWHVPRPGRDHPKNRPVLRQRRPARCPTSSRCKAFLGSRGEGLAQHRQPAAAYCALAWLTSAAAANCACAAVACCINAARKAPVTGAPGALRANFCGSWKAPLTRNSKCRCGPVAQPVAPVKPMV